MMLSSGDRVDRNRWRSGIDANRLAAGHGVARRVFAADVDRPGTIAQRLRVSSRHLHAPCAVCPHFCGIGFTVQRDGKRRALRQVLLVPDSVKPAACSLALITLSPAVVASVTLVSAVETVTVILPAEVVLLPSIWTTDRYVPRPPGSEVLPSRCRPLRPWCWRLCCRCCL